MENPTRPRRAPWITVHSPLTDGAPWIIERPGTNPLRVSDDVGELLSALDGERDTAALSAALGWTPDQVSDAVRMFSGLGLLLEPGNRPPSPERRFTTQSWTVLRLRVIEAARLLDPLRPMLTRLSGRAVLGTTGAVILAGLTALVVQRAPLADALSRPLPMSSGAMIWLGLGATTLVHELAHGATLTHFRGRPGWLGIMLFYLTPVCFCEVTDGWRLARPRQRVWVAMAGVATQAVIGSLAALLALALPTGDGRATVLGFAIASYLAGAVNLAPWIKLDGYLALMAYLDIPRLREKAMADARGWLVRVLFGVRYDRALPDRRWAVPFGLLCLVFPAVVLTLVIGRWSPLLLGLGVVGAAAKLLLTGFLLYWLGRKAFIALRDAKRGGAGRCRLAMASLVVSGMVALPLGLIEVRDDTRAGYVVDPSGVHLVLPPLTTVRPGESVLLQRKGIFLTTDLGTARTGAGEPRAMKVPAEALMPFRSGSAIDAVIVPLDDAPVSRLDTRGGATVPGGSRPLGRWLLREHVLTVWKHLFKGEE
ncbi:daptide biosynthesis intramembrane metalloprotease [Amycolatopsis sp. NPDC059021]|uniref:daptide biosynthesis intramembrane metalloprotease n=1 Tax=Amycolatopsis sp. NPDC059021 TaxID=3346704 RepID=UPI00366EA5FD